MEKVKIPNGSAHLSSDSLFCDRALLVVFGVVRSTYRFHLFVVRTIAAIAATITMTVAIVHPTSSVGLVKVRLFDLLVRRFRFFLCFSRILEQSTVSGLSYVSKGTLPSS